jgi:outer membrane protein assembly factor BamB
LYAAKRPLLKPITFILIVASFILAACSGQLPNQNWPGLTAVGDIAYVARGQDVIAYDVARQSEVWRFPTERSSTQYYAAPAVEDGQIVLGDFGASGGMLSPKTIVHILKLQEQSGPPAILWDKAGVATDKVVAPPLIVGDRVFVGTADSRVLAMDRETGELLWPTPFVAENAIWGEPVFAEDVLYVAALDGRVYAINPDSGDELGRWDTEGAIAGSPVLHNGRIYVGSFDNKLHALDQNEFGRELWSYSAANWVWGAPVVAEDVIYFGDLSGNVFAVDAETGELVWQRQVTGPIQTSPTIADGVVYVVSEGVREDERGQLTAFSASDGAQLWQQQALGQVYTTPVIIGDTVVLALTGNIADALVGYSRDSGAQQWSFVPPAR